MVRKGDDNEDGDDDLLYFCRFNPINPSPQSPSRPSSSSSRCNPPTGGKGGGSGGLAPSKSTVYVSNIDYNLTNSDVHTLFSTFGKVAKVTILKDRASRKSKGVAFVLFVSRSDAVNAANQMNGKILNGRTLTASIATDNGRAPEFIRRKIYMDKSRCYECGDAGHLSYECPKNQLGPRERPPPSKRARRHQLGGGGRVEWDSDDGDRAEENAGFEDDNWASVVDPRGADERTNCFEKRVADMSGQKSSYFSDESGDED